MQNYKNGVNKLANQPTNFFHGERFFQKFRCQLCAVLDVVAEHGVQFRRCLLVEDESVRLVVVTEAAAVQVGGAERCRTSRRSSLF